MNGLRFYFSAVRRRDIIKAGEELRDRGKESFGGFEKLPRARIQFRPSWNLPEDENVLIFRFKSSDYRMLCVKDKKREVLYIIGFDFDFSAYDHGD